MASGYQPRVSAGGTTPLPMASGEAFGAGVGRAVSDLGGSVEELALVEKQVKRNEENASAGLGLQKALAATQDYEAQDRDGKTEGWQPRGVGHQARVLQTYDQQATAVLDGVTDPKVRMALQERIQANRNSIAERTDMFAAGQRLQGFDEDSKGLVAAVSSRVGQSDDPSDIADALDDLHATINAMDAPPAAKEAALRNAELQANHGFLLGQADRNPDHVAPLIQSGKFNGLGEPVLATIQNSADAEIRRRAAIQEHQVALAKAAAHETIATVQAKQAAGIVVPDAELNQAAQLAQSIGDTSSAVTVSALQVHNNVAKSTQAWTPAQYDTVIGALRAKGDKRTPEEDVQLKALETIAPQRKTEFRENPGAWAALSGHPAPALDYNDPASLAARARWQHSVSVTAGEPVAFLQPAEVEQLKAVAADSPKGKFDVINQVANIGALDPHRAQAAIRQVLPDDALAARLVVLAAPARAATMNGAEVRKADKTVVDGAGPNAAGTAALAKFNHDVAPALALLRPEDAQATYEIAGNMYANWAHVNGVHSFNPDQFGFFLHSALGAQRDQSGVLHGGIGYWNNVPVWLPHQQSQPQFEAVLSHMNWKPEDPRAPVFDNGTPMTPADIRKLTPMQRPDGRYEFHGPNGIVATNRSHTPFVAELDALGKRLLR